MQRKSKKRELRIWFTKDQCIEWDAKNLKPSEMCLMAAVIWDSALKMMGDCEIGEGNVISRGEGFKACMPSKPRSRSKGR